jgi:hypothetical protein
MLGDEEGVFDDLLRDRVPGAGWFCSQPGPLGLHQVHLHASLARALECGKIQAFLRLPFGASLPPTVVVADGVEVPQGPPGKAIVQFLPARQRVDQTGTHFEAGRLAINWNEDQVGEQMHQTLVEQARIVWSVLKASTRPAKIEDEQARRLVGYRIGDSALAITKTKGVPLSRPGPQRFHPI